MQTESTFKEEGKKETKHNREEKRGEREIIPVGSFRSGKYEISSINQREIINCKIYGSARGHIQSLKRGKLQKKNISNMFLTNHHELFKASLRVKTGGKHTCYEFLWILKSTKKQLFWDVTKWKHDDEMMIIFTARLYECLPVMPGTIYMSRDRKIYLGADEMTHPLRKERRSENLPMIT